MIGFLFNYNLAPIGFLVISMCSPADLFEQRARNVPLASADVRGGGRLCDEPKERLRRRLYYQLQVGVYNKPWMKRHESANITDAS